MNIKQRRCLSEMTGSSSLSPFVPPHYLSAYLYFSYPFTLKKLSCSFYFLCTSFFDSIVCVQHDAGLRRKKHKYSPCQCICFEMLTLSYKSVIFDEWLLFSPPAFSLVWCFPRVLPTFQFIIIKTMPCAVFSNWGQRVQIQRGQRYFNGSNIWLLMTNTISPQFKFQIDPWEQLFLGERNTPLGLCSTHLLI